MLLKINKNKCNQCLIHKASRVQAATKYVDRYRTGVFKIQKKKTNKFEISCYLYNMTLILYVSHNLFLIVKLF